jgi:Skp family chaperone for outer membrane proteins
MVKLKNLLVGLSVILMLLTSFGVKAEVNYAVVNIKYVLDSSDAAKNIMEQMKAYGQELQAQAQKDAESLRTMRKALDEKSKKPGANKTELAKSEEDLRKREQALQEKYKKKQESFQAVLQEAVQQVEKVAVDIINQVVQEKGYEFILDAAAAVWSNPKNDITDTVLKKLNSSISKVAVKKPA